MRIANATHWNTKDLSRLIYRVAQDELDRGQLRYARVKVEYARGGHLGGNCTYGTMLQPHVRMTLRLPRPGKQMDVVSLAKIIAHELGHSKGIKHADMHNVRYGWVEGWRERYAYAAEFAIGVKPSPAKLSPEEKLAKRRTEAVAKAQKMVRKWTTAHKRADTMLRKWRGRLRAAEKRATSASPHTTQPLPSTNDPRPATMLEADNREDRIPSLAS